MAGGNIGRVLQNRQNGGLDICGFDVVNVENNTALHLKAFQAPSAKTLEEDGLNLLTHYANLVSDNSKTFKEFSPYLLADAYFSKKTFVDSVIKILKFIAFMNLVFLSQSRHRRS